MQADVSTQMNSVGLMTMLEMKGRRRSAEQVHFAPDDTVRGQVKQ